MIKIQLPVITSAPLITYRVIFVKVRLSQEKKSEFCFADEVMLVYDRRVDVSLGVCVAMFCTSQHFDAPRLGTPPGASIESCHLSAGVPQVRP